MIQGALEADGRIAAKNATKIRAALMEMADYKKIFLQYQETQPISTQNKAQDNARARSWAIMNVRLRTEALASTLWRTWAEAYVLGEAAADEWIKKTIQANKAADDGYIDWKNWQPGDKAGALMLRRPGAFQRLLDQTNVTIKGMERTSITDIGNALATTIELGLDAERASILIGKHVASASRSLTIAITEQNRAMSAATIQRYKDANLEKMEWHVSNPCDKCAQNAGAVVPIGTSFPTGATQPPQHPHCRCVLLPVIPGFDEDDATPTGTTLVTPPAPPELPPAFPTPKQQIEQTVAELQNRTIDPGQAIYEKLDNRPFIPGKWEVVPREAMREVELSNIIRMRTTPIDRARAAVIYDIHAKKMDRDFVAKGVVYKNGPIEVQFGGVGLAVKEEMRKQVIEEVEKLQLSNPKNRVAVHITKDSKNKYGWAYLGQEDLWVVPKIVKDAELKVSGAGKFKMPVTPTTTQFQYTLAHEWGHLVDNLAQGSLSRQAERTTEVIKKLKKEFPDAFTSGYSGNNSREFYAEMFTEYYRTAGQTDNKLVQAMATEFGWKVPGGVVQPKPVPVPAPVEPAKAKTVKAKYNNQDDFDKEAIIALTKIKENQLAPATIWNGATQEYQTSYRYPGDDRLKAIIQKQGFDALPTVLSADDFAVLEQLGATVVHRGVTATSTKTANQMIKEFKDGDMFVGTGVIGNGVYTGTDLSYVIKYAGDKPENVMTMALSPKARTINAEDAKNQAATYKNAFFDKAFGRPYTDPQAGRFVDSFGDIDKETLRQLGIIYQDPGRYAALNGYDAIKYVDEDGGVFVILNRGAMRVKE
jgi:hypothetical protein